MCHLRDKLGLGERLGWLAQLQSRDEEGPEHSALREAGSPAQTKGSRRVPRHWDTSNLATKNHTWMALPPAVILAVDHLVTAGGEAFSSAL